MDDLLALTGAALVLAGIYLWVGLAATLIAAGLALIYAGWRYEPAEAGSGPDTAQETNHEPD
jgi:H+/Cl- antiporter ClcA